MWYHLAVRRSASAASQHPVRVALLDDGEHPKHPRVLPSILGYSTAFSPDSKNEDTRPRECRRAPERRMLRILNIPRIPSIPNASVGTRLLFLLPEDSSGIRATTWWRGAEHPSASGASSGQRTATVSNDGAVATANADWPSKPRRSAPFGVGLRQWPPARRRVRASSLRLPPSPPPPPPLPPPPTPPPLLLLLLPTPPPPAVALPHFSGVLQCNRPVRFVVETSLLRIGVSSFVSAPAGWPLYLLPLALSP